MNPAEEFNQQTDPEDLRNVVYDLGQRVAELELKLLAVNKLREITRNGNDVLLSSVDDNGNEQFVVDEDDGKIYLASRELVLGDEGIGILNELDGLRFIAQDGLAIMLLGLTNDYTFRMILVRLDNTTNVISNGDFETGDFTGWTETDADNKVDVVDATITEPHTGAYCARWISSGSTSIRNLNVTGLTSDKYYVTFWAKEDEDGIGSNYVTVECGSESQQVRVLDTSWRKYHMVFMEPATNIKIYANGDVYVDDVEAYRVDQAPQLEFIDDIGDPSFRFSFAPIEGVWVDEPSAPDTGRGLLFMSETVNAWKTKVGGRVSVLPAAGWEPYATVNGWHAGMTFASSTALAADGGIAAIPILLNAPMLLESVSIINGNVSLTREWNWGIYVQDTNTGDSAENSVRRVAYSNGKETFTAAGQSLRTLGVTGTTAYLAPGLYFLLIQNQNASNNFLLSNEAVGASMGNIWRRSNITRAIPLGTSINVSGWTSFTSLPGVRLNGRVVGETALY